MLLTASATYTSQADGSPLFSAAAEGAPVGDGFGSEREVNSAREQAPQHEAGFVDRLRAAAGQAAARAGHAAAALRSFTLRLATLVAKSVVLGVTAQLAQRQRLQKLAAEQRQRAQAKLVAATAARQAAQDQLRAALAAHSRGDRAFVKMLLSQDNPARTLEDKWGDLSRAMRGDRAPELRWVCVAVYVTSAFSGHHAWSLHHSSQAQSSLAVRFPLQTSPQRLLPCKASLARACVNES